MKTTALRWRKAFLNALLVHLGLFFLGGYAWGNLFAFTPPTDTYIELALISELQSVPSEVSGDSPASNPSSASQIATPSIPSVSPLAVKAGPLSMTEADMPGETQTVASRSSESQPGGYNGEKNTGPSQGNSARRSIIAPSILRKSEASYPPAARQASMEGTVDIKVQILETGQPGTVAVARSSGHSLLDDTAVKTIQQWRFVPAKDSETGKALVSYTTIPIAFYLK